jgi:hypothetical protein
MAELKRRTKKAMRITFRVLSTPLEASSELCLERFETLGRVLFKTAFD